MEVYKASAGSGKTYTLALEYIKELILSKNNYAHRHILAVTFTKDATAEMKDRILAELYGLAFDCADSLTFKKSMQQCLLLKGHKLSDSQIQAKAKAVLDAILHDYSRLYITTIDSFFQKVLRNLARELGSGSKFNLEMNSMKVLAEAVHAVIENANQKPQVLEWLTTYIENKLDQDSNWRIQQDILDFSRCLFDEYFQENEHLLKAQIKEDPKIFQNLWKLENNKQKEATLIFSKAYKTFAQILMQHALEPDDFSRKGNVISFVKKLADADYASAKIGQTIADCALDNEKWAASKSKHKKQIAILADQQMMPILNQCLETLTTFNTSRMITANLHQLGLVWDISEEISRQNADNNRFMLADTALFLNKMIDQADAPFIYEKIGAQIKHVMIDEFQDTSRLQWGNFKSLLANITANNDFSLIVGDVKQSIYRWRNGDWSILNDIEKQLPVNIHSLSFNYRSEREIILFNNDFFLKAAQTLNEKFIADFGSIFKSPFASTYQSEDLLQKSHKKERLGYVALKLLEDCKEEGGYAQMMLDETLEQIKELERKNIPPQKICILCRTNKHIIAIADFLASKKSEMPELQQKKYLDIVSSEAFLLKSSPALKILILALRSLCEPLNKIHRSCLLKVMDQSKVYINWEDMLLEKNLAKIPLLELIAILIQKLNLDSLYGQSAYLFTFQDALNTFLKQAPADLYSLLYFWDSELQFKAVPAGTSIEGIQSMTIHKSKGLQFDTLIIPFCDWDLFPAKSPIVWCGSKMGEYKLALLPVRYTKKMQDTVFIDEYREETANAWMDNLNLLYVAFTRAERNLIVLGKKKKKLENLEQIKTVADLLYYVNEAQYDLSRGELLPPDEKLVTETDNILKKTIKAIPSIYKSMPLDKKKSIFKQSNQSREFIRNIKDDIKDDNYSNPAEAQDKQYIKRGNLLHKIFEGIKRMSDIPLMVEKFASQGLILPKEKDQYIDKITLAIVSSGKQEWFTDKYAAFNECEIICQQNECVVSKRPDLVLCNDKETIVVDYKSGKIRPEHHTQIQEYVDLLKQMNFPNPWAYIFPIN